MTDRNCPRSEEPEGFTVIGDFGHPIVVSQADLPEFTRGVRFVCILCVVLAPLILGLSWT